ncbi:MAG TPA: IS607 family transposase [Ktedonobacterales bacterium]|nr:IS607 family transposase [Ktedonobacterales bacterium]
MENTYSIGQFARLTGRGVKTLQKWDRAGILKAHRTPTGRRYYTHDQYLEYRGLKATGAGKTIAYARVSTQGQKPDLQNQVAALRAYCQAQNIQVDEWVEEIGSGLNYQRKQFNRIMEEIELGRVQRLIIAHKDRLARFGFEWFAAFCERHGTDLVIVNGETLSPEQELVQDLLSIVHIFSARLYGLRSYKKVIRDAALQKDQTRG